MLGRRPPAAVKAILKSEERVLAWGVVANADSPASERSAESARSAKSGWSAGSGRSAEPDRSARSGRYVVATNLGLWWPQVPPRRIPWHLIVRATWAERGLTVVEADVVDDLLLVERPPLLAALVTEGKIPPAVRKRVEASIVSTHEVRLDDGPARVVCRRVTGQDGQLWLARLGPQTADTEQARAQLRALVSRFRADDEARREALLK